MRKLTLKLFSDFLSPDGKYVDYKGIGTSKSFEVRKTPSLNIYCSLVMFAFTKP